MPSITNRLVTKNLCENGESGYILRNLEVVCRNSKVGDSCPQTVMAMCAVRSIMAVCAARSSDFSSLIGLVPHCPAAGQIACCRLRLPSAVPPPPASPFCSLSTRLYRSYSILCRPYAAVQDAEERIVEFGEEKDVQTEEEEDLVGQRKITPATVRFQVLGNKEKKELRAYAHGLGSKLNVQMVGKLGVSQTVVNSISDALEAHEILKVKVLENCSSTMDEIVLQLERGTGGQVVGKIGRTVLLYRASLRKLATSEKRQEKAKRASKTAMTSTSKFQTSQRFRK